MRSLYSIGFVYLAASAFVLVRAPRAPAPLQLVASTTAVTDGAQWFEQVRPSCNALEAAMAHRRLPPPESLEGLGFSAACWALAGRPEEARRQMLRVPAADRWKAAGIVFAVGHPIADLGDDRSAGPMMELVIEFWPNHYQALYHAGVARYALGDYASAHRHLRQFLSYYEQDDGWTRSARAMLLEIGLR